jgi:two-component system phosphate regulon sensor histidine kinase PhoR
LTTDDLAKLAALIHAEQNALLVRWRQQLRKLPSAEHLDVPTLNDHIPGFLRELSKVLRSKSDENMLDSQTESSPLAHGSQRFEDGFDIEEVVAEYNLLRGCVYDLADENALNLQGESFHIFNRVFDEAIGMAVKTFAAQRVLDIRRRREEYLAFVAHDLRTPLGAIAMAAAVLEAKQPQLLASPTTGQMLAILRRNIHQLESLIGKILQENANLRTDSGVSVERRTFDLWPVVESLHHDLSTLADDNRTRLINNVPQDLVVEADAGLLRRVFQNLIANAIKHTPGGEVTVEAKEVAADSLIECSVSDNGSGISPDLIGKVFDKGESGPEDTDGTGLGLAIVKTFVEAHGGTVSVESTEGTGATFRFSLPSNTERNA